MIIGLVVNTRLSFLQCQLLYTSCFNGMYGERLPTANLFLFFLNNRISLERFAMFRFLAWGFDTARLSGSVGLGLWRMPPV